MEAGEHVPQQISPHDVFFTPTVVHVDIFLAKPMPMYFKEMIEHAHHCIGTLAHVNRLINEVVDWLCSTLQRWVISLEGGSSWDPAGGGR